MLLPHRQFFPRLFLVGTRSQLLARRGFTATAVCADPTAEEFESNDFHVEKVIAGGKQITPWPMRMRSVLPATKARKLSGEDMCEYWVSA